MRAVRYQTIDGYQVVTRFVPRRVDRHATRRAARAATAADAAPLEFYASAARARVATMAYRDALRRIRRGHAVADLAELEQAARDAGAECGTVREAARVAHMAAAEASPVWRPLRAREVEPGPGVTPAALAALAPGQYLTVSGEVLTDYRGAQWVRPETGLEGGTTWHRGRVRKLGETVPPGAIRIEDLTDEQREAAGLPVVGELEEV